ncbi:SpoIIIAH-like family protein [Anaerosalibacter bizertensis]|uniref:SpoIIIAH-like family protein n=1 Tax=Anaerosalibacter bizertensis TaxID=932217 RepID=A0A9Q4FL02_9FIRM|nr:SpoIIIAH-like family protein [Anaerosalibacter bizertensis]MBV1817388.1 SpoIIIAH-like family protein [Bacteroidales bacterium MSK.15.36]MCB5558468.1 SpoIIIAH-like family protein [Anaerosalibacter bizertensis]MCG4564232.1 SpoIIIAH-like family protein [Anaerosalibacter bizertensis]MCG4581663.1 SpoIIIAH-like family protein [Anaerosalibacter bizertensis]MCG4584381.1 SpoIIIAH-like family protein [Anaerosalibacter bizertensis]
MFTIKKPAIITILVALLVLTGYINHQMTQNSVSKISNDYQNHEEKELAKTQQENNKDSIETISKEKDSKKENVGKEGENLSNLTEEINTNIEKNISKEENLKSRNYFVEHRLSRDKMRANLVDDLKDIVDDEKTNNEVRAKAQSEIIKMGEISEQELHIEGLIKAKGFDEALVFLKGDGAKIVVSSDELTEQDVVKILDIVKSETELDSSNIKIMKKQ